MLALSEEVPDLNHQGRGSIISGRYAFAMVQSLSVAGNKECKLEDMLAQHV